MKLFGCLKCFIFVFAVFATGTLHADISSVGFVHAKILELKGIDLPIPAGVTADQVNSVHYMMTQIDAVNAQNGTVTHYADGPEATMNIMSADQVVANVTNLVMEPVGEFKVTLTGMTANSGFRFQISAAGNFTIDWGDGNIEQFYKVSDNHLYTHTYVAAGDYVVTITGRATYYFYSYSDGPYGAISFVNSMNKEKITAVSGDLGTLFPVLNIHNNFTPNFYQTFKGCIGLTKIPANLFASVSSAPIPYMFSETFQGCSGLTGEIPSGLFAGISGKPANYMFQNTFSGCTGLTSIPPGLFAGISGAPAFHIFQSTFDGCIGITSIPAGLFSGISGKPAQAMFLATFRNCSGLTGEIPSGLFGTFSGASAPSMFTGTFAGCTGLTSIDDGIWDLSGVIYSSFQEFESMFQGCSGITSASPNIAPGSSERLYDNLTLIAGGHTMRTFLGCTNMADSASIPNDWK